MVAGQQGKHSRRVHDLLASRILAALQQKQVLPPGEAPGWANFHTFRARVHDAFYVPETSITPLMARVLWGIASLARPHHLLVLGSYAGNTLVWLAGPVLPEAERIIGIEIDPQAVDMARQNFERLQAPRVQLICGDALRVMSALEGPVDLVLIDIDDPRERRAPYVRMLEAVYPLLAPGGLVLAHDICVERFKGDLMPYLVAVRQFQRFSCSVPLEIDACGLEISVKKGR